MSDSSQLKLEGQGKVINYNSQADLEKGSRSDVQVRSNGIGGIDAYFKNPGKVIDTVMKGLLLEAEHC